MFHNPLLSVPDVEAADQTTCVDVLWGPRFDDKRTSCQSFANTPVQQRVKRICTDVDFHEHIYLGSCLKLHGNAEFSERIEPISRKFVLCSISNHLVGSFSVPLRRIVSKRVLRVKGKNL